MKKKIPSTEKSVVNWPIAGDTTSTTNFQNNLAMFQEIYTI